MKTDRLIGILSLLPQKEKEMVPVLAEGFEVSGRTINRDMEDFGKAGKEVRSAVRRIAEETMKIIWRIRNDAIRRIWNYGR